MTDRETEVEGILDFGQTIGKELMGMLVAHVLSLHTGPGGERDPGSNEANCIQSEGKASAEQMPGPLASCHEDMAFLGDDGNLEKALHGILMLLL